MSQNIANLQNANPNFNCSNQKTSNRYNFNYPTHCIAFTLLKESQRLKFFMENLIIKTNQQANQPQIKIELPNWFGVEKTHLNIKLLGINSDEYQKIDEIRGHN
ncbi:unnamed protein product [Paramecium octaurelia]|uniref:Uncharacterized protein n=1 Tax=Paramecium octaurelia TaxID=43137 RepID=A0A8S1U895_PAROT|nr:unnamed protein product [Paramecium octaurelia]